MWESTRALQAFCSPAGGAQPEIESLTGSPSLSILVEREKVNGKSCSDQDTVCKLMGSKDGEAVRISGQLCNVSYGADLLGPGQPIFCSRGL